MMPASRSKGSPSTRLVIIEFPTSERARAWYNDPDYAPLITLRDSGSRSEITMVEGVS